MRAKPVNPTKRKLVRPSSCVTVEVSEPTNEKERKKEREIVKGGERKGTIPNHRNRPRVRVVGGRRGRTVRRM